MSEKFPVNEQHSALASSEMLTHFFQVLPKMAECSYDLFEKYLPKAKLWLGTSELASLVEWLLSDFWSKFNTNPEFQTLPSTIERVFAKQ